MHKIGMSDCGEKNLRYVDFLSKVQGTQVIVLGKGSVDELDGCDGLVLTGGEDVSPELYGDWPDETVHINSERDGFEFRLIDMALEKGIPVLGICRGLQILNVFFGGTLIIDLEKYYHRNHKSVSDKEDSFHGVTLTGSSRLEGFTRQGSGEVNSSHHQAADRIGSGLKIVARAVDGTVEAIEGNDELPSRIVSVQWHPERMRFENPFAHGVLDLFASCLSNNRNNEKYAHGG